MEWGSEQQQVWSSPGGQQPMHRDESPPRPTLVSPASYDAASDYGDEEEVEAWQAAQHGKSRPRSDTGGNEQDPSDTAATAALRDAFSMIKVDGE